MELPEELKEERDVLVAMIYEAFDGVTREGGISWSQADAIDDYCSDDEIREAGKKDSEHRWQDLVGKEMFDDVKSNWSFLDAIGFRYYLAPAMIDCLKGGDGGCVEYHLVLGTEFPWWPREEHLDKFTLDKWSRIDARQSVVVAQFLAFMFKWESDVCEEDWMVTEEWKRALDSYWSKFLDSE